MCCTRWRTRGSGNEWGSQELLSAIDKVPWSKLEHAYGPAIDVPDLIRALMSGDSKVRKTAWSELHGNIWHQGTIYEASAYAVPIFLDLLRTPTAWEERSPCFPCAPFTGSRLGCSPALAIDQEQIRKLEFQHKLEAELAWVEATKNAVVKGREIYIELLQSGDVGARIAAAYLVGPDWRQRLRYPRIGNQGGWRMIGRVPHPSRSLRRVRAQLRLLTPTQSPPAVPPTPPPAVSSTT